MDRLPPRTTEDFSLKLTPDMLLMRLFLEMFPNPDTFPSILRFQILGRAIDPPGGSIDINFDAVTLLSARITDEQRYEEE